MSDKPKYLTIDEAIDQLQVIAAQSPLGGDTVVCVCISGIEYQPVSEIKMDRSQDGAIALVMQPFDLEAYDEQPGK